MASDDMDRVDPDSDVWDERWTVVDADLLTVLDRPGLKGGKNGQYSYRDGEVWYVVQHGPGFCNKFRVTDYDNAGLRWLKRIEWKEEQRAKDRAL